MHDIRAAICTVQMSTAGSGQALAYRETDAQILQRNLYLPLMAGLLFKEQLDTLFLACLDETPVATTGIITSGLGSEETTCSLGKLGLVATFIAVQSYGTKDPSAS